MSTPKKGRLVSLRSSESRLSGTPKGNYESAFDDDVSPGGKSGGCSGANASASPEDVEGHDDDDGNEQGTLLPELRHERESAESFDSGDEASFPDAWFAEYGTNVSEAFVRNRFDAAELIEEVIIGTDDRVRITNVDKKPLKWLCSLVIRAANGKGYVGSGFLVGRRTIITAGHCVYMSKQGGWASQITVHVARNGSSAAHTFTVPKSALRSTAGWVNQGRPESDYGAIILPQNLPASYGNFDVTVRDTSYLNNRLVNVVGYPGDKPPGQMWGHGRKLKSVNAETLVYDIDTYGGQSGTAVFEGEDPYTVVGIHNYGDLSGNSATRITDAVKARIDSWL